MDENVAAVATVTHGPAIVDGGTGYGIQVTAVLVRGADSLKRPGAGVVAHKVIVVTTEVADRPALVCGCTIDTVERRGAIEYRSPRSG